MGAYDVQELGMRQARGWGGVNGAGRQREAGLGGLPGQALGSSQGAVLPAQSPIPARWRHLLWGGSRTADSTEGPENLG